MKRSSEGWRGEGRVRGVGSDGGVEWEGWGVMEG